MIVILKNVLRFMRLRPSIEEMEMVLKSYDEGDDRSRKTMENILEKNGFGPEVIQNGWRNIEEDNRLHREFLQTLRQA